MVFIILPLATDKTATTTPSDSLQENEMHGYDGDVDIPDASDPYSSKLAKLSTVIVTPGETVTEDTQWMRHVSPLFHFTFYFCPLLTSPHNDTNTLPYPNPENTPPLTHI